MSNDHQEEELKSNTTSDNSEVLVTGSDHVKAGSTTTRTFSPVTACRRLDSSSQAGARTTARRMLGPTPSDFKSIGVGWRLGVRTSNQLPAAAPGPETTLWTAAGPRASVYTNQMPPRVF